MSSSPIDSRTTSGPAPAAVFCASVSWRCVVDAGRITSERVSPMWATWRTVQLFHQRDAGVVAALQTEGEDAAGAARAVSLRQLVIAIALEAGVGTQLTFSWPLRCRAAMRALSLWRCMRKDNVSIPFRIRNELNGEIAGRDRARQHAAGDREAEIAEGLGEDHAAVFGPGRESMG